MFSKAEDFIGQNTIFDLCLYVNVDRSNLVCIINYSSCFSITIQHSNTLQYGLGSSCTNQQAIYLLQCLLIFADVR